MNIWPVIHYGDFVYAESNAEIAYRLGCPGVFLISMDGQDNFLPDAIQRLKDLFPKLKIGVNYLTISDPLDAYEQSFKDSADMLWVDKSGVTGDPTFSYSERQQELYKILTSVRNFELFGSVAFKYQKSEKNPIDAAIRAAGLGMIPTTSGPETGKAPTIDKIKGMSQALNDNLPGQRFAIASGVTPENVRLFLPYVTDILVSTGISKDFYRFDETKLKALIGQSEWRL